MVGFLYLLIMGGLIPALVLALVFSCSGLAEKLDVFGHQIMASAA